jgi:hypothetical protein
MTRYEKGNMAMIPPTIQQTVVERRMDWGGICGRERVG